MEGIPRTSHCNIKHRVDPHEYLYDYQGKRVSPHIDLLPDVISLKPFLGMVHSSSESTLLARSVDNPSDLSRSYLKRNVGKSTVKSHFICFCF